MNIMISKTHAMNLVKTQEQIQRFLVVAYDCSDDGFIGSGALVYNQMIKNKMIKNVDNVKYESYNEFRYIKK